MSKKSILFSGDNLTSVKALHLYLAFISLIVVFVATLKCQIPIDKATEVTGFFAFILSIVIEYQSTLSFSLSLVRVIKAFSLVLSLLFILYALLSLYKLDEVLGMHGDTNTKEVVSNWIFKTRLATLSMLIPIFILSIYSVWKYHRLRYAEARLGELKDVIIRIERILKKNTPLSDRKEEAMKLVLNGLRHIIRLTPSNQALSLVRYFRPATGQIALIYSIPNHSANNFQIKHIIYPD